MRSRIYALALAAVFVFGLAAPCLASGPSFDELDTNKDGKLSKAEASKVKDLDFAKADTNKDGSLDRTEYESAIS